MAKSQSQINRIVITSLTDVIFMKVLTMLRSSVMTPDL